MKQKLLAFLSKLPIARWLKPVWKFALIQAVDPIVDWLADELSKAVQRGVGKAGKEAKELIVSFEDRVRDRIRGSFIPDNQEEILIAGVVSLCEQLKAAVPVALESGSSAAVEEKIKALLQAGGENLKNQIRAL